jgi:lactate permease
MDFNLALFIPFYLALVPIIFLIIALGILRIPGYKACPAALLLTMIIAAAVWKMPVINAVTAALEGGALAFWPIIVIIIAAVFTYNLSIHTKSMEIIKKMLTSISTDKRILTLLLAYGFGGFLEAIAGFGTSVAIPAGIMAALGFEPVFAAIICLVANTTPTAFASVGLPITTLAKLTNLDAGQLGFTITLQLFVLIIILPIVLVMLTGKSVKAIKGVLGITLVSGISFAVPQFIASRYLGAELPAILGSVICLTSTIVVAKVFYKESNSKIDGVSFREGFMAWLPFILVFVFVILTSSLVPAINKPLSNVKTTLEIYPGHYNTFQWLSSPGTIIIFATFLGGLMQGAKPLEMLQVFCNTCKQMSKTALTILTIVALAKVMSYSGMIKDIAIVLVAITGGFYPIISPFIGAIGTFITGSDTSSNILFGELQVEAAKSLGVNPYWLAAANTAGATGGKMISPQSIAVATAATGLTGAEGKLLKTTIKFCLVYVALLGLITFFGQRIVMFI